MSAKLKVIGATWCGDTRRTRAHLDAIGVTYEYVDIDENPAAEKWITQQNHGKRLTPTVEIAGKLLFEPSDTQLDAAMSNAGML